MKTAKKLTAILLVAVMCFSFFSFSSSAYEEKQNYLVLGDSIAEGFGVSNKDEAAYGRIVADTNGYNYVNKAHMGYDSADLLNFLTNRQDYIDEVKKADIISISIGGNDFLLNNAVGLLIDGIILNRDERFDKIAEQYKENFSQCIEIILDLNPDAVILVQTVYNSWTAEYARNTFNKCSSRINQVIFNYLEENPDSYYIVDVAPYFEYKKEYISSDTVHPNTQGNIVIATLVLEKLCEIGLSSNAEPVILAQGVDRDYLNEYFGKFLGPIITFLANFATGNL